jgi:alginate O-acetyltransferase complex protein AlgI
MITDLVSPARSTLSRFRAKWLDWLPLVALPAAFYAFTPPQWPAWALMWSLAVGIYAGCKWLTWKRASVARAPWWQHAGYLIAWPGLDADAFLQPPDRSSAAPPRLGPGGLLSGAANMAVGVFLFFYTAPALAIERPLLAGWIGFAAIVLFLHFGMFQILSCVWRWFGVNAAPLMNKPLLSSNVGEFWGRRWNRAFRDLTRKFLFRPLASRYGAKAALLWGFLFSGLVHDFVISVPAGAGLGGPTLFFLIQAAGILVERSRRGKELGLDRGWRGWLFTMLLLVGPAWLLFHPPFATHVVVPFVVDVNSMGSVWETN